MVLAWSDGTRYDSPIDYLLDQQGAASYHNDSSSQTNTKVAENDTPNTRIDALNTGVGIRTGEEGAKKMERVERDSSVKNSMPKTGAALKRLDDAQNKVDQYTDWTKNTKINRAPIANSNNPEGIQGPVSPDLIKYAQEIIKQRRKGLNQESMKDQVGEDVTNLPAPSSDNRLRNAIYGNQKPVDPALAGQAEQWLGGGKPPGHMNEEDINE